MRTQLDTERMMRYDANKKSALLAYILWFFLGFFGLHRMYLGPRRLGHRHARAARPVLADLL